MLNLKEEGNIFNQGFEIIGAIDEAGRGPLAGPVVAACVVLRKDETLPNFINGNQNLKSINDSKKLTEKKREELFGVIQEEFSEVGVGICEPETIDRINILQATFLAMKKAIGALKQKPDFVVLDGQFLIPNISVKQKAIISGDGLVFSIAAASIIAKVSRDRIMREAHQAYPRYGFDRHKGYGTKAHMDCLKKFGPCPIHRKSFAPVRRSIKQGVEE